MGLEPTSGGTTIHCLNHLATPAMFFQLNHYNKSDGKRKRVDPFFCPLMSPPTKNPSSTPWDLSLCGHRLKSDRLFRLNGTSGGVQGIIH